MNLMSHLRLSTRIYVQQIILLVALVFIAVYSLYSIGFVNKEITLVRDQQLPLSNNLTYATESILEFEHQVERVLRHGPLMRTNGESESQFDDATSEIQELGTKISNQFDQAEQRLTSLMESEDGAEHYDTYKDVETRLGPLRKQFQSYLSVTQQIISGFRSGENVSDLIGGELEVMEKALAKDAEDFSHEVADVLEEPLAASADSLETLSSSLWVLAIITTVVALTMAIMTGSILASLRKSMASIGNSIQQVASASSQSSNAIGLVSDGAKQQSQAIDQAVTAVNQSVSVLADVSTNAEKATSLSKQAAETVTVGQQQMTEMIAVVRRISENSGKINKITDMIDDIANQTNMLSLNAAIEAARAGEHGKGFAVVADQVRKLAENSRNSVKEIVDLISIASTDAGAAVDVADRVNTEMEKISESADNTERMMRSIATAMEEQVATTEELQHNMDTLKGIGENNANAAEEITQTVMELSRIADEANTEVNRFNI